VTDQPGRYGDGAPPAAPASPPEPEPSAEPTEPEAVEAVSDEAFEEAAAAVEADLADVIAQRDDYLDALRRVQADFENFKKQTIRRNTEHIERAAEGLVRAVLPVLDACDAALAHGATDVKPIHDTLLDVLAKEGLTPIRPEDEPFDPAHHEAVVHDPADPGDDGPEVVTEVLRTGYLWKGRVLRPAMVRVRG
jgi:molecular chaperone GrpE